MADSFATIYDDLRMMESVMERAINNEPLFNEDVPPIARSHANISIAVDATGTFANPFAAAAEAEVDAAPAIDDAKEMDAKVSTISFTEKNKICPEIWTHGKFQMTRHNVEKKQLNITVRTSVQRIASVLLP
jgi:hypothetical protein